MIIAEYTFTIYHSPDWDRLVEQGWRTMRVFGDIAYMIRETERRIT